MVAGPDLRVWILDERARELLDIPPEAAPSCALDPSRPATSELRELVRRCLRHGLEARRALTLRPEGPRVAARVCPLPLPDGSSGVVALLRDESVHERLQEECLGLLGRVAHDLRSPLTVIQGFIEAILEQKTTPTERRRFLSLALDQTRLMARMLTGLGESLEILSGHAETGCERVDVSRCIRETLEAYSPGLSQRRIRVEPAVPEGLPDVRGDEVAIKRVLVNLLDNAARHCGDGGMIRVQCEKRPGSVAVCVADSGPGIPPELIERIWDPFVSLQETSARLRRGGTGLGLASVRSLVEAMGGETWVVSEQGRGAQFWFTLPRWVETGGS
ncbi:MAG: hypothetical protein KatS3mg024_0897 [Armatimonadota bacterium]|nr:MAG: hypothetical protein KatS3mg024_0897 [Armatimonadota bacterium]